MPEAEHLVGVVLKVAAELDRAAGAENDAQSSSSYRVPSFFAASSSLVSATNFTPRACMCDQSCARWMSCGSVHVISLCDLPIGGTMMLTLLKKIVPASCFTSSAFIVCVIISTWASRS